MTQKLIEDGGKALVRNKTVLSVLPETVSTAINTYTPPVVVGPSSATPKVANVVSHYVPDPSYPNFISSDGPVYGVHSPIEAVINEVTKDKHKKWKNSGVEKIKSTTLVDTLLSSAENKADDDDDDLLSSLSIEQITKILEKYAALKQKLEEYTALKQKLEKHAVLKQKTIAWLLTNPSQKEKDLVIKANQKIKKFLEYCSKELSDKATTSKLGLDLPDHLKPPKHPFTQGGGEEVYAGFKIPKEGLKSDLNTSLFRKD